MIIVYRRGHTHVSQRDFSNMSSEEERDMIRLSQVSQLSNVSLELSQNTLNDLLMANANG